MPPGYCVRLRGGGGLQIALGALRTLVETLGASVHGRRLESYASRPMGKTAFISIIFIIILGPLGHCTKPLEDPTAPQEALGVITMGGGP